MMQFSHNLVEIVFPLFSYPIISYLHHITWSKQGWSKWDYLCFFFRSSAMWTQISRILFIYRLFLKIVLKLSRLSLFFFFVFHNFAVFVVSCFSLLVVTLTFKNRRNLAVLVTICMYHSTTLRLLGNFRGVRANKMSHQNKIRVREQFRKSQITFSMPKNLIEVSFVTIEWIKTYRLLESGEKCE